MIRVDKCVLFNMQACWCTENKTWKRLVISHSPKTTSRSITSRLQSDENNAKRCNLLPNLENYGQAHPSFAQQPLFLNGHRKDVWPQIADRCRHHGRYSLMLPLPQTEIWEDKEKKRSFRFLQGQYKFSSPAAGNRISSQNMLCLMTQWLKRRKNVTASGQMKRKWVWELCVAVCGYLFRILWQ